MTVITQADREMMAKKFERVDMIRLRIPHDDGYMHKEVLISGDDIAKLVTMIRCPMTAAQ